LKKGNSKEKMMAKSNSISKIELKRFYSNDVYTIGGIFIDGVFVCFTIEDAGRVVKVMHKTRIPAGRYRLSLQRSGRFHDRYKKRFPFHDGMILVNNVPNFTGILIHLGNSSKDTSGCIIPGMSHVAGLDWVSDSTKAYQLLYIPIKNALLQGKILHLTVVDELS
jgi:hypothetical protein